MRVAKSSYPQGLNILRAGILRARARYVKLRLSALCMTVLTLDPEPGQARSPHDSRRIPGITIDLHGTSYYGLYRDGNEDRMDSAIDGVVDFT